MDIVWGALLVGCLPFLGLILGIATKPKARAAVTPGWKASR